MRITFLGILRLLQGNKGAVVELRDMDRVVATATMPEFSEVDNLDRTVVALKVEILEDNSLKYILEAK